MGARPSRKPLPVNIKPLGDILKRQPWPTPTIADVTGGRKARSGNRADEMLLNGLMAAWSTPTVADIREGAPVVKWEANGVPLAQQMTAAAWSTPAARDWRSDRGQKTSEEQYGSKGRPLAPQILKATRETATGSNASTAKRGAGLVPNSFFACRPLRWPRSRRVCFVAPFKGRADAWRLAGNAIVPQDAAEFIRALMESRL